MMADKGTADGDGVRRQLDEHCRKLFGHSTIFLGNYTERRWVPHLNRYKDVVVVSQSEHELRNKLFKLRMDVHENFQGLQTSNIVLAATFTMIYTNLPFGCPFGAHWLKLSHVRLDPKENDVQFKVKVVRSVDPKDFDNPSDSMVENKPQDVPEMLWSDVMQRLQFALTVPNAVQFVRVTMLVLLTVGMGLYVAVKSTAQFLLRFIREVSILVHSCTPFLLGVSNIISKIFGGILILLSMIWKDVFYLARRKIDPNGTPAMSDPRQPARAVPAISYYGNQYNTPVTRYGGYRKHNQRHGVTITELN